ncbi:MAG: LytTR family transcriptional regulator [Bacteroidales bacterium]|nr:LytTR family transcriptional regulator [Bacteroidales bacterium]
MLQRNSLTPKNFQHPGTQILHILGIPAFFITFVIVYKPFNFETLLTFEKAKFHFNTIMIAAIMLVIYTASRATMGGIRKKVHLTLGWYIFWCIMEVVGISLFSALYFWLVSGRQGLYLNILFTALAYIASILIIPYSIITMALVLRQRNLDREMTDDSNTGRLRFYDDKHNLKLAVIKSSILFIQAEENYVHIHFTENDKVRDFILRSSMKRIEELCQSNGLVRCHRSYFINPEHVKLLKKGKDGILYAELDQVESMNIPISKRYAEQLEKLL